MGPQSMSQRSLLPPTTFFPPYGEGDPFITPDIEACNSKGSVRAECMRRVEVLILRLLHTIVKEAQATALRGCHGPHSGEALAELSSPSTSRRTDREEGPPILCADPTPVDPPRRTWRASSIFQLRNELLVLRLLYQNVRTHTVSTQRDFYYRLAREVPHQRVLNDAIHRLGHTLRLPREAMGVVAGARGCIGGSVSYKGINLSGPALGPEGLPIPVLSHDLRVAQRRRRQWESLFASDAANAEAAAEGLPGAFHIHDAARAIVVVEKHAVYYRLMQEQLPRLFPCVLLTSHGFPTQAARQLLQALHRAAPELPVVGLVDHNPSGLAILLQYKYNGLLESIPAHRAAIRSSRDGTTSAIVTVHERRSQPLWAARVGAAVPQLRWLGPRSCHIMGLTPTEPFSSRDKALMQRLRHGMKRAATANCPVPGEVQEGVRQELTAACPLQSGAGAAVISEEEAILEPLPATWLAEADSMLRGNVKVDMEALYPNTPYYKHLTLGPSRAAATFSATTSELAYANHPRRTLLTDAILFTLQPSVLTLLRIAIDHYGCGIHGHNLPKPQVEQEDSGDDDVGTGNRTTATFTSFKSDSCSTGLCIPRDVLTVAAAAVSEAMVMHGRFFKLWTLDSAKAGRHEDASGEEGDRRRVGVAAASSIFDASEQEGPRVGYGMAATVEALLGFPGDLLVAFLLPALEDLKRSEPQNYHTNSLILSAIERTGPQFIRAAVLLSAAAVAEAIGVPTLFDSFSTSLPANEMSEEDDRVPALSFDQLTEELRAKRRQYHQQQLLSDEPVGRQPSSRTGRCHITVAKRTSGTTSHLGAGDSTSRVVTPETALVLPIATLPNDNLLTGFLGCEVSTLTAQLLGVCGHLADFAHTLHTRSQESVEASALQNAQLTVDAPRLVQTRAHIHQPHHRVIRDSTTLSVTQENGADFPATPGQLNSHYSPPSPSTSCGLGLQLSELFATAGMEQQMQRFMRSIPPPPPASENASKKRYRPSTSPPRNDEEGIRRGGRLRVVWRQVKDPLAAPLSPVSFADAVHLDRFPCITESIKQQPSLKPPRRGKCGGVGKVRKADATTEEALGEMDEALCAVDAVFTGRLSIDNASWGYGRNRVAVVGASFIALSRQNPTTAVGEGVGPRVTDGIALGQLMHETGLMHNTFGETFAMEVETERRW